MPKLTLTFDTYDERQEMLDSIHGTSYAAVLQTIDTTLRNFAKYEGRATVDIDYVRQLIRQETEGLPIEW